MIMNKNIKIAKELVRIAKSLVAWNINIANHPGKYKNFTGKIEYNQSNGWATNATFEIPVMKKQGQYQIIWYNGTWQGDFFHSLWKNGTWKGGRFHVGTFEKGTWERGSWYNGVWKGGTWKDGWWMDGIWENGTWEGGTWSEGYDKYKNKHGEGDSPDKW